MAKKEPELPETKTFNLREAETALLMFITNHQQAIFSGLLSTIAADRLSYKVTERTQFNLNAGMTELRITEVPALEPENPIKTST